MSVNKGTLDVRQTTAARGAQITVTNTVANPTSVTQFLAGHTLPIYVGGNYAGVVVGTTTVTNPDGTGDVGGQFVALNALGRVKKLTNNINPVVPAVTPAGAGKLVRVQDNPDLVRDFTYTATDTLTVT